MSAYEDAKRALTEANIGDPIDRVEQAGMSERIVHMMCGVAETAKGELRILLVLNGREYSATAKQMAELIVHISDVVSVVAKTQKK